MSEILAAPPPLRGRIFRSIFTAAAPVRARAFVFVATAVVAACYLFYLAFYEFNRSEWYPYGVPQNLLITVGLTAVFVTFIHVLTGRFWFAFVAGMSLVLLIAAVSDLKFQMNGFSMTVIDLFILDPASLAFAWSQPDFKWYFVGTALVLALITAVFLCERHGGMRFISRLVGLVTALTVFAGSLFAIFPSGRDAALSIGSSYHVTIFAKSMLAMGDYFGQAGIIEKLPFDPKAVVPAAATCRVPAGTLLPHIIVISDEASIDTTRLPGLVPDPKLVDHFKSYDGVARSLSVETYGGGTWLTELSVLTGLSTRTFGPFSAIATRLVADRVKQSLPQWLNECGYFTRSIYPAGGRFVSARKMHDGLGVQKFEDWYDLKALDPTLKEDLQQRDHIYYDYTLERIAQMPNRPSFTYLWMTGNHTPWTNILDPDAKIEDVPASPSAKIAEYRRRQRLSDIDLRAFKDNLKAKFPAERFVILRYGDHLPFIGGKLIDPTLTDEQAWARIGAHDPRYFKTYFAIDTVNFTPVAPMPAYETIAAPYLGMLLLKLVGLPLNPVAQQQAAMIDRCKGEYLGCEKGVPVKQLNAWLSQQGLISGL